VIVSQRSFVPSTRCGEFLFDFGVPIAFQQYFPCQVNKNLGTLDTPFGNCLASGIPGNIMSLTRLSNVSLEIRLALLRKERYKL